MAVDTSQAATALLTEHLQYTPLVCIWPPGGITANTSLVPH